VHPYANFMWTVHFQLLVLSWSPIN